MASPIVRGQNFGSTELVTATKLQNIVDSASFKNPDGSTEVFNVSGSDLGTCVAAGGLEVKDNKGQLQIKDNGVTLAKMATQADQTVLGNVSGGSAVPTAVPIVGAAGILINNDSLGTDDTKGATQGNIKAYVDSIRPNIVAATKNTTETISFSSENETKDVAGLEITITPRLASSTFIISGYVSAGFYDANRDYAGIVKYKLNSGSYATHNLPTGVGSRIATHFKMLQTDNDESDIMPFTFTIPFSGLSYSVGDTLTFKLTVTNINTTNDLFINRGQTDTDSNDHSRSISTILVQEV